MNGKSSMDFPSERSRHRLKTALCEIHMKCIREHGGRRSPPPGSVTAEDGPRGRE